MNLAGHCDLCAATVGEGEERSVLEMEMEMEIWKAIEGVEEDSALVQNTREGPKILGWGEERLIYCRAGLDRCLTRLPG